MKSVSKLIIHWQREEPDSDEFDLALEHILGLIKDGYTSGYADGNILSWELK